MLPPPILLTPSFHAEACGADIFKSAILVKLATQQRSQSDQHNKNIASLRCTDPSERPITQHLLDQYQFLSSSDLARDPCFRETAIAVGTNACRHQIILTRLTSDAIASSSAVLAWRNPLTGDNAGRLSEDEIEHLYRTHPALTSFFLPGSPCFCLDNWNPGKGLFNGTAAVQHSIILDPRENRDTLDEAIHAAEPGKIVMLQYPPKYVNVRLTETQLPSSESLDRAHIIVPIPQWGSPRLQKIKAHHFPHHFPPIRTINYRSYPSPTSSSFAL